MAVSVKKLAFAVSMKQRLDYLACSYTDGLDEAAIADLLLNPGEGRLKILQWLFSRYDYRLADLLDLSQSSVGTRTESRLQRLLTAAHALCLCHLDDIDLIRGEGSLSKQIGFVDQLLDLVCTRHKFSSSSSDASLPQPSPAHSNDYLDALVSQNGYLDMLNARVELLPRDIHAEVEKLWTQDGWDRQKSPPRPSLQDLATQSDNLANELQKQNSVLLSLKQQITLQGNDKNAELITMTQMLAMVIRELRQLADGFLRCYESSIRQWCHKTPPELSELGAVFKRVHAYMQMFVKLLEDLNKIRQVQTKLGKTVRKDPEVLNYAQVSREASDSFQRCLTVLEETLHREDSNFTSKYAAVLTV